MDIEHLIANSLLVWWLRASCLILHVSSFEPALPQCNIICFYYNGFLNAIKHGQGNSNLTDSPISYNRRTQKMFLQVGRDCPTKTYLKIQAKYKKDILNVIIGVLFVI